MKFYTKLVDQYVHNLVFSNAIKKMRRKNRTCEIPTLAEGCARARRIVPTTRSPRASRSSPWPERRATPRVPTRSVTGSTP